MEAPETRTALEKIRAGRMTPYKPCELNKFMEGIMNAAYTPKQDEVETLTLAQQVYALEVELQEVVQAHAESLQDISTYLERINNLEKQLDALSRANERLRNCSWLLRIFRLT